MTLQTTSFGPFTRGVIDSANPAVEMTGALRHAREFYMAGMQELAVRPGLLQLLPVLLLDDQTARQPVTTVVYIGPFQSGAVVIGYSSITQKTYLYYFSDPTFQSGYLTVGPIWTGMSVAPDVQVAEGLGELYIAHTLAADQNGLYWNTAFWDGVSTFTGGAQLPPLLVNGTYVNGIPTAGTDVAYFLGVIAFETALWGWGYGSGNTAANGFRPELIKFSPPDFGLFQGTDSITLGDEVRSIRQRVLGGALAGEALVLAGTEFVTRITGFGRNSWYKQPVDRSYGAVGPKAICSVGDAVYYWSPRGLMRIQGAPASTASYQLPRAEVLFDSTVATAAAQVNPEKTILVFDPDRDQVLVFYDAGRGVRQFLAYDTRRNVYLGPDSDIGFVVYCANTVRPVINSAGTPGIGPSGPPSNLQTSAITTGGATATWTNADPLANTIISLSQSLINGGAPFVYQIVPAGTTTVTFSGLIPGTYSWTAQASRNGQVSAIVGPTTATMFTTLGTLAQLPPPTNVVATVQPGSPNPIIGITWMNSDPSAFTAIFINGGFLVQVGQGLASYVTQTTDRGTIGITCQAVADGFRPSVLSAVASVTIP